MFWGASTAWWLGAWISESDVNLNSDSPVPSCMTIYSGAFQWPCRDRRLLQLWPGLNENTRTVTAQCLARSRYCYFNFHCYYYCCNYYLQFSEGVFSENLLNITHFVFILKEMCTKVAFLSLLFRPHDVSKMHKFFPHALFNLILATTWTVDLFAPHVTGQERKSSKRTSNWPKVKDIKCQNFSPGLLIQDSP